MKIRNKLWIYVWVLSVILVSGCNKSSPIEPLPDLGIPSNEMNTRIHLESPIGLNTFKIGDLIGISVDVITNDQIAFQYDYGAKIFMLEKDKWIEIPNFMKYPEGYQVLSQSKGDPFKLGAAGLDPILPELQNPVTLRIVLIGNLYRNGQITDQQTAGYIDVVLKP